MVRLLITTPRKIHSPLSGLIFYKDGQPVGQAVIQERRTKKDKWKDIEITEEEK